MNKRQQGKAEKLAASGYKKIKDRNPLSPQEVKAILSNIRSNPSQKEKLVHVILKSLKLQAKEAAANGSERENKKTEAI